MVKTKQTKQSAYAYDFIIVGAGSAGCVLANRLSADPTTRVLVIEAGGANRSPLVGTPKGAAKTMGMDRYTWRFPVSTASGSSQEMWVRGRGIGGSSAINGMIYVKGHPADYQAWNDLAGGNWSWDRMREAFRAIEDYDLEPTEWRGVGGPVHISSAVYRYPLAERFIAAGVEMGLERHDDLNTPTQEGIGYYPHTIKRGRRVSAADAFLSPVRRRPNLTVLKDTFVTRIGFDGVRAVGVEAVRAGAQMEYRCRGEVLLTAGTMMSPVILQHSGVGDAEVLRRAGVDVLSDRPLVGRGMFEHIGFTMPHRLVGVAGLNRRYRGAGVLPDLVRYGLTRTGPIATGPFEVGAFVRTRSDAARPNAQLLVSAYSQAGDEYRAEKLPGMTVMGFILQPSSRGSVLIEHADPTKTPRVEMNWLETEDDRRQLIELVRYIRTYVSQSSIAEVIGEELFPGPANQSDGDLLDALRRGYMSGYHNVGTCAMGRSSDAVLDGELRVRGVDGVRVVDCSAMPGLISGNTNGPAMAMAWRAADLILGS
jgi:choline dehydrogenase